MEWYHAALASLALIALLLSWNVPRCGKWIFLATMSYIVSVAYYRLSPGGHLYPPGPVVAFFCDASVFVMIRQAHKEKWEFYGLGSLMMFSATLNLLQVMSDATGVPPMLPQLIYSEILEVTNALYLSIIGGIGMMDWKHEIDLARNRASGVDRTFYLAAREKSKVQKIRLK